MRFTRLFLILSLIGVQAQAWDLHSLGGADTEYTPAILEYLKAPPESVDTKNDDKGIGTQCFSNSKNEYYIGVAQYYKVYAAVDKVEKLLFQFENYPKWFDGLISAGSSKESDHRYLISFEQYVPVPLVPNIKYKMIYESDDSDANRKLIRYQFSSGKTIKAYDGFILLQKVDEAHTQVIEYDFIDADWGLAKMMGKSSVWSESLLGMLQTDLALKLRAENPELTDKEVMKQSKEKSKEADLHTCIDHKLRFQYLAN